MTMLQYVDIPKVVKLHPDTPMDIDTALTLINEWGVQRARYEFLERYYYGKHDILNRYFEDISKPNNKLVNNFARYITDIRVGYFTGIPITYDSDDNEMLNTVKEILAMNDEPDTSSELDKMTNIYGHAMELFWIDGEGNIRFKAITPKEMILVYSTELDDKLLYGIRYYEEVNPIDKVTTLYVDIYSNTDIQHYTITKYNSSISDKSLINVEPHYFGIVPIIEYFNNAERLSSYEDVIPLIDAYNIAQSDSVNEIQYFNDAYLKLKNVGGTTDEDIQAMKQNRVLLVEGDGDAEWLTKEINDAYLEHIKERIAKDIHKFSKTPNLVSEEFIANLSGTAIRYKVWGLEQDTAQKERKWKKSIKKRLQLIANILNLKGKAIDVTQIRVIFNRNLPQNVMELSQMVSQLRGSVSLRTLLGQLPFVNDVEKELGYLESEKTPYEDIKFPYNEDDTPEDNANALQNAGE